MESFSEVTTLKVAYLMDCLQLKSESSSLAKGLSTLSSGWIFDLVWSRSLDVWKASTHSWMP